MMRPLYTLSLFILILTWGPTTPAFADLREPELKTLDAYSRLVFPLGSSGSFKIEGKASGATAHLSLQRAKVDAWSDLSGLRDQRIASVKAAPRGLDSADLQIDFKQNNTEFFAYLQPAPPAVIVDIWPKFAGADKAPARSLASVKKNVTKKSLAPVKKAVAVAPKPIRRSLASLTAGFAAARPIPEALSVDKDFFQRFSLPMPGFIAKGAKFSSPAETDLENQWVFGKEAQDKSDDLSIAYKFAIRLFKEKKYGLCVKSLEIMERDYPRSPYADEQNFLKAVAYKLLGETHQTPALVAKADASLRELMIKLDGHGRALPFSIAIRLYFTSKSYREQQWLEAVEQFEFIVKLLGESDPDYPVISLAMAESYRAIGQTRRAERIYRYVSERQRGKVLGKEALYRIGNILAIENNHKRAVEEIERALAAYPEYASTRTEAYFNLGEAYFQLRNYKKAQHAFSEFAHRSPSQTIAALAYVRLGEIAELTKRPADESRENYLKAINIFPFSEGATIAALRLGRLNLAQEPDIDYELRTIKEILKKSDLERDIRFMARLLLVQIQRYTHKPDEAIAESLSAMTENTGTPYEIFKEQFVLAHGEYLAQLVTEKKYSDALVDYEQNKKWLELYGPKIYQMLGEAYKGVGLYDSSNRYMAQYAQAMARENSAGGRKIASELKPAELQNFYSQGNYREVLRSIPADTKNMDEVWMAMVAHFKLQEYKDAYKLARQLREAAESMGDDVLVDTSEVLTHWAYADKNFAEMENILSEAKQKLKEPNERIDYLYGDSLWYQKKNAAAIEAYTKALELFPKSDRAERSRYYLAMSDIEVGKRKEGVKLLADLRDKGPGVWAASAKQELELLEWESKYSIILRGLPPSGLGIVR